jgi:hypothetical protein
VGCGKTVAMMRFDRENMAIMELRMHAPHFDQTYSAVLSSCSPRRRNFQQLKMLRCETKQTRGRCRQSIGVFER